MLFPFIKLVQSAWLEQTDLLHDIRTVYTCGKRTSMHVHPRTYLQFIDYMTQSSHFEILFLGFMKLNPWKEEKI